MSAEPWEFEYCLNDQRKYCVTVASLPRPRYRSAYVPGCSFGVLTELLATRCDRLLASDIIPDRWPSGRFDLVVFSEIAYHFDAIDLDCVMACVLESTVPGAHVVGVHRRAEAGDPLSGERSHQRIGGNSELVTVVHHREEEFVLDIWERR